MPAYILTGTPGAGKTAMLRLLETLGYPVVEEAASDVIALGQALGRAEPWREPTFIDNVAALQRRRQDAARATVGLATVFFDRSPACTLALSRYLGFPPPPSLTREVARIVADRTYEDTVFFIRNQGFIRNTAARKITLEDSLAFEQLHEETYRDLGFRLSDVPAGPLEERVAIVRRTIAAGGSREKACRGRDVAIGGLSQNG
jgi:predicted ATPase